MLAALGLGVEEAAERSQEVSQPVWGVVPQELSVRNPKAGVHFCWQVNQILGCLVHPQGPGSFMGDWVSQGRKGGGGDSKGPTC